VLGLVLMQDVVHVTACPARGTAWAVGPDPIAELQVLHLVVAHASFSCHSSYV